MSDVLRVYFNGVPVGKLWLDQKRRFQFSYEASWLAAVEAIPLSLSLPLQAETFEDDAALPLFFQLTTGIGRSPRAGAPAWFVGTK